MHIRQAIAAVLLSGLVLSPLPARAGGELAFVVDRFDDLPDASAEDNLCSVELDPEQGAAVCTLRAAVMQANALFGTYVRIELEAGETYVLDRPGPDDDSASEGDLDLLQPMWIGVPDASQARARIDGSHLDRIFDLATVDGPFVLSGLELVGGEVSTTGAAIRSFAPDLQIVRSDIHDNDAPDAITGAIHVHFGRTRLEDSHVHANGSDQYPFAGVRADSLHAQVTLIRSTISDHAGDGVLVKDSARVVLEDSTVSGNDRGIVSESGHVTARRSTIAGNADVQLALSNTFPEVMEIELAGSVLASDIVNIPACDFSNLGGYAVGTRALNIYGDASCVALVDMADQDSLTADPLLGMLGNNGGATPTRLPAASSPVIDHVTSDLCGNAKLDQRGFKRSVGIVEPGKPHCDAGAVEWQGEAFEHHIFSDGFE